MVSTTVMNNQTKQKATILKIAITLHYVSQTSQSNFNTAENVTKLTLSKTRKKENTFVKYVRTFL